MIAESVEMTLEQVEQKFKDILHALCEIDSSDVFKKLLESDTFAVDDDDMGYLIHETESMLADVHKENATKKQATRA